jgi:hypothetical protein
MKIYRQWLSNPGTISRAAQKSDSPASVRLSGLKGFPARRLPKPIRFCLALIRRELIKRNS